MESESQVSPDSDQLLSEDSPPVRELFPDPTVVFSVTKKSEKGRLPMFDMVINSFNCRITRAFLIEEVKLMKRMLQQKEKSGKKSKKTKGKGKKKM